MEEEMNDRYQETWNHKCPLCESDLYPIRGKIQLEKVLCEGQSDGICDFCISVIDEFIQVNEDQRIPLFKSFFHDRENFWKELENIKIIIDPNMKEGEWELKYD